MSGTTGIIMLLLWIVIAVAVNKKTGINIGIIGLFGAIFIGAWLGGGKPNKILSLFPTDLFFLLFLTSLFFGFASETKCFDGIADRFVYACRNHGWAIPLALWVGSFFICSLGAGPYGGPAITSPLAFTVSAAAGFDPLIAAALVWSSSVLSGHWPWGSTRNQVYGVYTTLFDEKGATIAANAARTNQYIMFLFVFLCCYFFCKGYKCKPLKDYPKPKAFTPEQKKSLYVVFGVLGCLCIPNILSVVMKHPVISWMTRCLDIRCMCLLGSIVFALMGGDMKKAIGKVSMNSIMMICGMCTLISVAEQIGVIDTLTELLQGGSIPTWLFMPALMLTCAVLGTFCNGVSVVVPLIAPIAVGLSGRLGISEYSMAAAVFCGSNSASISPLSTGGSMAQIGATVEQKQQIYGKQFKYLFFQVGMFVLASGLGMWSLIDRIVCF